VEQPLAAQLLVRRLVGFEQPDLHAASYSAAAQAQQLNRLILQATCALQAALRSSQVQQPVAATRHFQMIDNQPAHEAPHIA
jgi:hypothetical protein